MKIFLVLICLHFACGFNISTMGEINVSHDKKTLFFSGTLNTEGYIGVNFSHSMSKSDMIIIEITKRQGNVVFNIQDTWSVGYSRPETDVSLNGTDDITNKKYEKNSDGTYSFSFERPLTTHDDYDYQFNLKEQEMIHNISFAWNEGKFAFHKKNLIFTTYKLGNQKLVFDGEKEDL